MTQTASRSSKSLPLRWVLVVPFVIQIFAAVGLVGYLSFKNGQRSIRVLSQQLMGEINGRVEQHLDAYLAVPQELNQLNTKAAELKFIDLQDLERTGQYFAQQMEVHNLSYIFYALPNGDYAGAGRWMADQVVTVDEISAQTGGKNRTYSLDQQGKRKAVVFEAEYSPLQEDWYKRAMQSNQPIWSEIYSWEDTPEFISISASRPIHDSQNRPIGVMASDLLLSNISEFLQQLTVSRSGKIFILERDGNIVATSGTEKPFVLVNKVAERLNATQSSDALVRTTVANLQTKFGQLQAIQAEQQLNFKVDNDAYFAQINPWKDEYGLDWLVVVAVPESDFMAQINANTRSTILLCLGALAVATLLGVITSRWIARPILKLQRASEAIASGQLDQSVTVKGIGELEALGNSFNQMAGQLRTSFSELETRVEERTAELKEAKLAADGANQAKSEFLANMSHELRTPLNGILGYAQILQRSKRLPDKDRHGVDVIHQCGSHLLTLINDVLDLSKIEARKLELVPKALHFPSFLQGVVEICRIRADQKGIEFVYQPDSDLPEGVEADEKRLRQVLLNLIGNAVKFTEQGAVTLKVEVLENLGATIKLNFRVEDTGVGIAPDQISKIFQAFEQVGDQKKQAEGTGLGLAISQRIVELMGGEIQVKSQLGVGSDFLFIVEVPLVANWMQQAAINTGNQIVGYIGEPRRILVVDDRWENRAVLVNLLEQLGFEMAEADNGQSGLAQMRQTQPDLVITDMAMPVMDGFEMLKQLRCDADLQHLKVIVSSASVSQLDQQMALDAGGNDFLAKPVDAAELFALLASHLRLKWQYEVVEVAEPIEMPQSMSELVLPPAAELAELLDLAQQAKLKLLRQRLEVLVKANPHYASFAAPIQQYAKQFKAEEIEELLQKYMKQSV